MRKIAVSGKTASRIAVERAAPTRGRGRTASRRRRARRSAQPDFAELLDDRPEQRWAGWRGSAAGRCGVAERLAQRVERRRVVVVAVDVAQQPAELGEGRAVEPAVLLEAVARPRLELVEVPAGLGDADDRHVEVAALHHRLQRREDLLVGEVAGGAEEDERVGVRVAHRARPLASLAAGFSTWPPNSKRIADSSLSGKSASPRELKRSYSAAVSTGAGTPRRSRP